MSLLTRYLTKNNIFLLLCMLGSGIGIYLLVDIFERMDNFLGSSIGMGTVLLYFIFKLPSIVSQILPAIFLLSLVIQFCLMDKKRELTALQAGGVTPWVFVRFAIIYGLVWSLLQLGFSQVLGVSGEAASQAIWKEEVQKRSPDKPIEGIWFTEKNYLVHIGKALPRSGTGEDLLVYRLSPDGMRVEEIIRAEHFYITQNGSSALSRLPDMPEEALKAAQEADAQGRHYWLLYKGSNVNTSRFSNEPFTTLALPFRQDISAFVDAQMQSNKSAPISAMKLYETITRLEHAGSNVEGLLTRFHSTFAYAFSLLVMSLLSIAITQRTTNLYLASCYALLLTFAFYVVNTFSGTLGTNGKIPPLIAAWVADLAFFLLAVVYLLQRAIKDRQRTRRVNPVS